MTNSLSVCSSAKGGTMAKVGITERGDAGVDLSWSDKLNNCDYAVIITKNASNPELRNKILQNKEKILLHATITGWGNTKIEPNVPDPETEKNYIMNLIENDFEKEHLVWRVDPIIPTPEGYERLEKTFDMLEQTNILRARISVLDAYNHTKRRMKDAGYPLPYQGFSPSKDEFRKIDEILLKRKQKGWFIESCAEPFLTVPEKTGCVNKDDAKLFGITIDTNDINKQNRFGCLCCSAKTELLTKRQQCPHKCAYCYWK